MKHTHTKSIYGINIRIEIKGKDTYNSQSYNGTVLDCNTSITVPAGVNPEQCLADEIGAWLDAELSKHEFKYPEE